MKKEDIVAIAQELAKIMDKKSSTVKTDSLGRRRKPKRYDTTCLFSVNKQDLAKFTELCSNRSEVLRQKVREVLRKHGVEPVDKGE